MECWIGFLGKILTGNHGFFTMKYGENLQETMVFTIKYGGVL